MEQNFSSVDFNFGAFAPSFAYSNDIFELSFSQESRHLSYNRFYNGELLKKEVIASHPIVIINPVEPVFPDKRITSHLYVEFKNSIEIEPDFNGSVFLIVPVCIGVFLESSKTNELIDVLNFYPEKYALYGDPSHGFICRYIVSDVLFSRPQLNNFSEAVLELSLTNNSNYWIEIKKAVFNINQMKIYYNSDGTFLNAKMKVLNQNTAETEFEEIISKDFTRSVQIYQQRKFNIGLDSSKFVMELGL